ncbi:MAG: thioredoxin family protein [Planctomycetaceae bacterium]
MFAIPFAMADAGKSKFNKVLAVGDAAPEWKELPGTDGVSHGLADLADAKIVVVMFTCNHCPIAAAYEERVLALAKAYAGRGVQVAAISVSRLAADSLERLKLRAKEKGYPFPIVCDDTQTIGKAYGATCTPQFFVLSAGRKVAYMGAFDDNPEPDKAEKRYVIDAIEALLEGRQPPVKESLSRGCAIDYE